MAVVTEFARVKRTKEFSNASEHEATNTLHRLQFIFHTKNQWIIDNYRIQVDCCGSFGHSARK